MDESGLIALLNSLSTGELDRLADKLTEAAEACERLGHHSLVERLEAGKKALQECDPREFRKQVQTVVARLGHLR